jgi:hypothetical protein
MEFNINKIEQILKTENLYSDTLSSKTSEVIKQELAAKVESQKWCLGIDTNLNYHTDISGVLQKYQNQNSTVQPNFSSGAPETHNASYNYDPKSPNQTGFVMMPERGPGWVSNPGSPDSQRWGAPKLIEALIAVAAEWKRRGNTIPLVYGDISLARGGSFPPHVSHRDGVDIDIRAIGNVDGRVVYGGTNYNRNKTRELIKLIINNGILPVAIKDGRPQIGFQDPVLINEGLTLDWSGHKDHLHVRFIKR